MTQPSNPVLDFRQIDGLRKQMLLTHKDMCFFFGVSRMTYYKWQNGRSSPRPMSTAKIKTRLRQLLKVMTEESWPSPDVLAASQPERLDMLLAAVAKHSAAR